MMSLPTGVPSEFLKRKRELSDGRERAAVQRARAVLTESLHVLRSAVAFVPFEAILRMKRGRGAHVAVAGHLGDHTCGSNRKAAGVSLHQRLLWQGESRNGKAIDKNRLRLAGESGHGALHSEVGGLEDVDAIDLLHF